MANFEASCSTCATQYVSLHIYIYIDIDIYMYMYPMDIAKKTEDIEGSKLDPWKVNQGQW